MSQFGNVLRLILPGLLGVLLVLADGLGANDASATDLRRATFSLVLMKANQAQAARPQIEPKAQATPTDGDEQVEEEEPFSELNEALTAARSRLTELTKAAEIAKVAGELREKLQATEAENRQLKSVLSQLQTDIGELESGKQSAERRNQELAKISEEAAAEAKRLDEELVSMRWQNSQLSTTLSQTETTARETSEELNKLRQDSSSRAESLAAAADESATEIARLQRELDAAQERILIAERQQATSAAELAELRQTTEESSADSARLARDLDGTITELASVRTDLATKEEALESAGISLKTAEDEAKVLRDQLNGTRSETDQLRERLATAESDLEAYRTLNAGLEEQVKLLKTAAGEATDAARQNLLAVEDQINEINAALASVKADELVPGVGGPAVEDDGGPARTAAPARPVARPAGGDWVPRPSPPRATIQQQLIAAAASETVQAPNDAGSLIAGTEGRPAEGRQAGNDGAGISLASLTNDLPANRREDASALLRELKAERGSRGLSMTVPGELLFAVNSETIEPAAFDALANVAELVDLYGQRDVLIVGHTDAVGDAGYNQQLSERRAALVKKFFVENFQISANRLQIEGRGEQDPINSNATANGRNANRRVEVVILD